MAMTVEQLVAQAKSEITEVDAKQAQTLLEKGVTFIDVREPAECEKGTIPKAINLPRGVLEWRISADPALQDKQAPLVVYCQSGGRSALAAQILKQMGYADAASLAGGYAAWCEQQTNTGKR